jgi:hypothetical protein
MARPIEQVSGRSSSYMACTVALCDRYPQKAMSSRATPTGSS